MYDWKVIKYPKDGAFQIRNIFPHVQYYSIADLCDMS